MEKKKTIRNDLPVCGKEHILRQLCLKIHRKMLKYGKADENPKVFKVRKLIYQAKEFLKKGDYKPIYNENESTRNGYKFRIYDGKKEKDMVIMFLDNGDVLSMDVDTVPEYKIYDYETKSIFTTYCYDGDYNHI